MFNIYLTSPSNIDGRLASPILADSRPSLRVFVAPLVVTLDTFQVATFLDWAGHFSRCECRKSYFCSCEELGNVQEEEEPVGETAHLRMLSTRKTRRESSGTTVDYARNQSSCSHHGD